MAKSLFDLLKGVTKDKTKWEALSEEDQRVWNNYMITRWFSMEMELTDAMNDFQKYSNGILNSKNYYKMLHDVLPKYNFFLKYIKKKKESEIDNVFLEVFSRHYQLGKTVTYEYIIDLSKTNPNELIGILEAYGTKKEDVEKFKKQIKTLK